MGRYKVKTKDLHYCSAMQDSQLVMLIIEEAVENRSSENITNMIDMADDR